MSDRGAGPLVLDTHVWIWTMDGARDRLNDTAVRAIEQASRRGELLVSAISVSEVAMLAAKGRVTFARPLDDWIRTALRAPGLRLLPIEPEIAIESTRLPGGSALKDPADRLLVASARVAAGTLVTADREMIDYATTGYVRALDVSASSSRRR